jgi:hypothetical protein
LVLFVPILPLKFFPPLRRFVIAPANRDYTSAVQNQSYNPFGWFAFLERVPRIQTQT